MYGGLHAGPQLTTQIFSQGQKLEFKSGEARQIGKHFTSATKVVLQLEK
jgi:hypothetical protein